MTDSGGHKPTGRSLPSWMISRDTGKEPTDERGKQHGKPRTSQTRIQENETKTTSSESSLGANRSLKLLEGVVFVLSGFVNPERSMLRSQAMEMGAEYQADWNTNCTLLVCAFPNTPKFRQVQGDSGTIVSKEWITESYNQKHLVDMEPYLLNAGKPWRRQSSSTGASQDPKQSSSKNSQKKVDKSADSKSPASALTKKQSTQKHVKNEFSPSEVKKWAIDDMKRTISWLDNQEEKPDPSEIKKIAAEGILTCLQDAIDSLKEEQGMGKIIEQWNFVPRVVEELDKAGKSSVSKKDVYHSAIACKRIYEVELSNLEDDSANKKKRSKIQKGERNSCRKTESPSGEAPAYDSDDTIEMTEDEIREAYDTVSSSIHK